MDSLLLRTVTGSAPFLFVFDSRPRLAVLLLSILPPSSAYLSASHLSSHPIPSAFPVLSPITVVVSPSQRACHSPSGSAGSSNQPSSSSPLLSVGCYISASSPLPSCCPPSVFVVVFLLVFSSYQPYTVNYRLYLSLRDRTQGPTLAPLLLAAAAKAKTAAFSLGRLNLLLLLLVLVRLCCCCLLSCVLRSSSTPTALPASTVDFTLLRLQFCL